tara:strand:- start:89 stop:703 length:615 start_codon:yes stop_codon:yes gene_type:complete
MAQLLISDDAARDDAIGQLVTLCFEKGIHLNFLKHYILKRDESSQMALLGREDGWLVDDFLTRAYNQYMQSATALRDTASIDLPELTDCVIQYLEIRAAHSHRFDMEMLNIARCGEYNGVWALCDVHHIFNTMAYSGLWGADNESMLRFIERVPLPIRRRFFTQLDFEHNPFDSCDVENLHLHDPELPETVLVHGGNNTSKRYR